MYCGQWLVVQRSWTKRIFTSHFEKPSSCVTMSSGLRPGCSGFNKNENGYIPKLKNRLKLTNNKSPKNDIPYSDMLTQKLFYFRRPSEKRSEIATYFSIFKRF